MHAWHQEANATTTVGRPGTASGRGAPASGTNVMPVTGLPNICVSAAGLLGCAERAGDAATEMATAAAARVARSGEKVTRMASPSTPKTLVISNAHGERVGLSPDGAAITAILVRDRWGAIADVTVAAGGSAGKTIGRYANRIANARFSLDGRAYRLLPNDGPNCLHGGPDGFSKRMWSVSTGPARGPEASVRFALTSPDGDQGFPGSVHASVSFAFGDDSALWIEYAATTDAPTVVNLTNHVYFNLTAVPATTVANHELRIASSSYLPVNGSMIPTGAVAPVQGTARDFRTSRPLGTEPYDCTFVLDHADGALQRAAELYDEASGRRLVVKTTEPSLQLYTGKAGAVALETQHFPDAPNHANFPATVLRPGETLRSTTVYAFSVK